MNGEYVRDGQLMMAIRVKDTFDAEITEDQADELILLIRDASTISEQDTIIQNYLIYNGILA